MLRGKVVIPSFHGLHSGSALFPSLRNLMWLVGKGALFPQQITDAYLKKLPNLFLQPVLLQKIRTVLSFPIFGCRIF